MCSRCDACCSRCQDWLTLCCTFADTLLHVWKNRQTDRQDRQAGRQVDRQTDTQRERERERERNSETKHLVHDFHEFGALFHCSSHSDRRQLLIDPS